MSELEKILNAKLKEHLMNREYDVNCPNCNNVFSAFIGNNVCPYCSETIILKTNHNF